MSDEWDIGRDYIDGLIERAPRTGTNLELWDEAVELRQSFATLEGELAGAKAMLAELSVHGEPIPIIAEQVWRGLGESYRHRWRDHFSEAGSLEVRIRSATKRGRTKSGNHEQDRDLAFHACLRITIGDGRSLWTVIFEEAERRGLHFEGINAEQQRDTLYRRIKALTEDPLENVQGRVDMVLHLFLEKRSKEQKSDELAPSQA